jgi:hypothetical protein
VLPHSLSAEAPPAFVVYTSAPLSAPAPPGTSADPIVGTGADAVTCNDAVRGVAPMLFRL